MVLLFRFGFGVFFPHAYCIILLMNEWSFLFRRGETGNALVNSAVLGTKCFFKHRLFFSLYVRKCTPHAWEEKRYSLISYLSPFFTFKPDECLPGGQWLSPLPAKAFPSACGDWESSISDDSVWPPSAAGRRRHLCTRHSAVCNSLLSSAMGAIQMERVRPVLCLQLPGHSLQGLFVSTLNLSRVWYGLWQTAGMGTAWLGALILGSVTGECTRLVQVERNSMTFTPFILIYSTRTCLLWFVFRFFFSRNPGGSCFSAYTFYFSLAIAKF